MEDADSRTEWGAPKILTDLPTAWKPLCRGALEREPNPATKHWEVIYRVVRLTVAMLKRQNMVTKILFSHNNIFVSITKVWLNNMGAWIQISPIWILEPKWILHRDFQPQFNNRLSLHYTWPPEEPQECGLPQITTLLPNVIYVLVYIYANTLCPSLLF